jgi:hypothetical protein
VGLVVIAFVLAVLVMMSVGFVFAFVALLLRAALFLVLLPFRLLFGAVSLVLVLPFLILGGVLLFVGALFAILTPLLPLLFVVGVIWAAVHLTRRPRVV